MAKKLLLMALFLGFTLAFGGLASAQTTFDNSTFTFTLPTSIDANQQYTFTADVFNAAQPSTKATKGIWIREVDLNLPANYALAAEADQPAAPPCLHTGDGYCDHWEANFDSTANKITWQSFGTITTVEFGDIREQDTQHFAFLAITDNVPTNSFDWKLWGDDLGPQGGNGSFVEGAATISAVDDDVVDDDTTTDDDTITDDDAADDSGDNGGCGC